jgi:outer membrane protein assembly factor BamB
MQPRHLLLSSLAILLALLTSTATPAADWPTYRGDRERSGGSAESLQAPLHERWLYKAPAPPVSAWSAGEEERTIEGKLLGRRDQYDEAFHPVIAGDRLYFGSTVDHQLHCVDVATGKPHWTFYTGAPIRLAPTVADGRVYFGSDDGRAYCLDAVTGALQWQRRAGPADEWLLARAEMINRWPVRTGVLVDRGVAFFGAGIFPHEDVSLYAVDAATGEVLWRQDNISPRDAGRDDLSPQGYLLASDELLFVPSGRSLPAAFDRRTGELVHKRTFGWRTTAGGVIGGTQALLADGQLYASGPHHFLALEQKSGDVGFGWFAGRQIVVRGEEAYIATGTAVARLDRGTYAANSRKRHDLEMQIYDLSRKVSARDPMSDEYRATIEAAKAELERIGDVGIIWQQPAQHDSALLAAGDLVFVGGADHVVAYSAADGRKVWEADVSGDARGLVVAAGHLFVSTSDGNIHCFSPASGGREAADGDSIASDTPYPQDDLTDLYARSAEDILKHTGANRGYCLVLGSEEGRLAYELARRSRLKVYCIEPDAAKVERSRKALTSAGLYGHQIVVHQADLNDIPYANYFANLIVSDALLTTGQFPFDPAKVARHLKPVGGVLCLGQPATGRNPVSPRNRVSESLAQTGLGDQSEAKLIDNWAVLTRGPLPGAGSWSHQYGNPANTAIGDDTRVKGGLGVLWYGDPGPGDMVNRHDGAVGPLSVNGRLFVQGETTIKAYDAYNGMHLWTYENPEAIRTGVYQNQSPGNLAADGDRLFHFIKGECFELDAATGEVKATHRLPPDKDDAAHQWGYVAIQDGLLFGTATTRPEVAAQQRRRGKATEDATDAIFTIDLATGKHLWSYAGKSISHHTIALGPERVFFIDSSITSEQRAEVLRQDKSHLAQLEGKEREIAEERVKNADVRTAVALDARTGEQLWAEPVDVTDCSEIGIGGGKLTLIYQDGVLVLCGANANGHFWKQFVAGEFERRRLVALSAEDGYKMWAKDANYRHRPIVIGEHVLAEPWMFDLKTGDQITREHPLTGEEVPWSMMRTGHHCGMLTGCDSGMIMFRSGFTGFYDLNSDAGAEHFAGHRLGCWINAIPANGLVLIPEASAGCVCLFSIASTVVLEPREPRRPWSIYSAVGAPTPVKHMAINLGAPGDRKDENGTVWFSYPRNKAYQETSLDVKLDLDPKFGAGGGFRSINEFNADVKVERNSFRSPWLYTSWAEVLNRLTLPLLGKDDPPATYTVRLYVADVREGAPEPCVFDVQIAGKMVLRDVSSKPLGSSAGAGVYEMKGVRVEGELVLEFVAKRGAVMVNAVEAIRDN